MIKDGHDPLIPINGQDRSRSRRLPPPAEPPTIHYTELPPSRPGVALAQEWEVYRREVGRLLAEGNEGRYVLIQGEQILGIRNTREEAMATGHERCAGQAFFVHQIQERERVLRFRWVHCS